MTKNAPPTPSTVFVMGKQTPDGDLLSRTGLRAAAAGVPDDHPDAELMRLLGALAEIEATRDSALKAWTDKPRNSSARRDAKQAFLQAAEVMEKSWRRVCATPATTADGAQAKIRFVLDRAADWGGIHSQLPLSALMDVLVIGLRGDS